VEGIRPGKVVAESTLQTTGDPGRLQLTADRATLNADRQGLAFVTVEAVDEKGRLQMNSDSRVQCAVSGAGSIAAIGNGDGQFRVSYSGGTYKLFYRPAVVVLRITREAGKIGLRASADGINASSLVVESKQVVSLHELR
jgi:beta-galactosidase